MLGSEDTRRIASLKIALAILQNIYHAGKKGVTLMGDKKKLVRMGIACTAGLVTIAACGFLAQNNMAVCVYGPPEDFYEDYSEESESEAYDSEEFDPEDNEMECIYGPPEDFSEDDSEKPDSEESETEEDVSEKSESEAHHFEEYRPEQNRPVVIYGPPEMFELKRRDEQEKK